MAGESERSCIFCMIVRGEMDAKRVYEDDSILAFDDIMPQAPIHTLIIPKTHYDHMGDGVPGDLIAHLFAAVPSIAALKGVAESGYRVVVNNGPDSQQSVKHLHVHVMGGRSMSHGMVRFADED